MLPLTLNCHLCRLPVTLDRPMFAPNLLDDYTIDIDSRLVDIGRPC